MGNILPFHKTYRKDKFQKQKSPLYLHVKERGKRKKKEQRLTEPILQMKAK